MSGLLSVVYHVWFGVLLPQPHLSSVTHDTMIDAAASSISHPHSVLNVIIAKGITCSELWLSVPSLLACDTQVAPWSSGQDISLSRRSRQFNSARGHQIIL